MVPVQHQPLPPLPQPQPSPPDALVERLVAMGYTRRQVEFAYNSIGCIHDARQVTLFLLDNPTICDIEVCDDNPELEEVRRGAKTVRAVRECAVCLQGEAEMSGWVMLRPCGHVCVCRDCAGNLSECPKCRRAVVECISAFLN